MPPKYQIRKIKVTDLSLDAQNPRFVSLTQKDQSAIISYLLKYEDVINLARSISSYGGLMPGEFPIVYIENGNNYIVEGNRRVCSCKILLDPSLAPAEYRASIPTITKLTRVAIKKVQVHIVSSREEAQIVLGTRHIQGVKRWPSVSKFMFFAKHFEAGKSISEIELLTGVSKGVITRSLKKHYFLQYILSLDCWTDLEKQNRVNYASLHQVGVDRILRIFSTDGSKELKISYDDHYRPVSELPDFGKIVEHIVRRVLNILPGKSPITTRNSFSGIRGDVKDWLPATTTGRTKPSGQTEFYLENLTYNISPSTDEDRALIAICEEIKLLSRGGSYRQYTLATSYLTRALIEQSCKRYLKINDAAAYRRLSNHNRDSSLTKILCYFCNNPSLFPDNNYHRLFIGLFPNGRGIKDIMDLNMHQPGLSLPTGPLLESWVSAGLRRLLEYLLK
jgi:hypothetical protein